MKEHIIINNDRTVIVPASVYKIGNQYEHNVNKVTFDCPRYADDEHTIDLSAMKIYINYIRPDKKPLSSLAENVTVDEADPTIMHFDFNITRTVTLVDGVLDCLVCIKSTNSEGVEEHHWNSDIFSKLTVGKGMENEETIAEENIDLITQLLVNLDTTNAEVSDVSERIDGVENRVDRVEGDIDELKGDLANIIYKGLINGFDKDNTVGGYLSNNGNVNSDSRFVTSDYFDVHENKTYYALQMVGTVKYDNVSYICFYDSSKTFITGGYFNASSCTSPNGSKYARVTFPSDETIKARCMFTSVEIPDKYYPFGYEYSIITKDVSELKTNVSELKTSKFENRLYGKSMAILGDSMAKGHTLAEEQTWAYKIASRNNMTYQKVAVNGTFITTGHGDSADANCLLQQLSRITGNPDIIIIHMGTNDRVQNTDIGNWSSGNTDTTNIYGALRVAFEYILEHFTTSKVMFITPYYYREQTDYIGAIENACNGIGTVHCKNNKQGGICAWNDYVKSTYFIDTVHLNELGQERASYEYEGFMRTFM